MLINFMTAFILEKIDSRTDKQAEVIRMYEAHPDNTLEEIGQKLGYQKNPGINVSKTLARSNYHFTHAAEHELIQLLKRSEERRVGKEYRAGGWGGEKREEEDG